MKPITKEMIKIYNIKKLKYDFMGYKVDRIQSLSFHHLIVPHKDSRAAGIGDGYLLWNGALLVQETSHDYLHIIEAIDREIFLAITQQMIEENQLGRLDIKNLKRIRDLLLYFEKEHSTVKNKKGKLLIKQKYITNRIDLGV